MASAAATATPLTASRRRIRELSVVVLVEEWSVLTRRRLTRRSASPATGAADAPGAAAGPQRLMLVASTGGHLAQLVALRNWWGTHDRTWVTFDKADSRSHLAGEKVIHAFHPTTRNVPNLLRNAWLAVRVVPRERPSLVVNTGAGVALPFFLVARALGIPTLYLEVYDRIEDTTMTGRLCRHIATAFCVQWPEQRAGYAGAEVTGTLL